MKALKILLITVLALGMSTGYAGTTESDPYRDALGSKSEKELAVFSLNLASGMNTGYAKTTEKKKEVAEIEREWIEKSIDTGLDEYCVTGDLEIFKKIILPNGQDDIDNSKLKKYSDKACKEKSLSESYNNNSAGYASDYDPEVRGKAHNSLFELYVNKNLTVTEMADRAIAERCQLKYMISNRHIISNIKFFFEHRDFCSMWNSLE